ncbi:MAG: type IV secretory system conjugative DNA transfer family protein, partial [Geminicoccaceae bacterium]
AEERERVICESFGKFRWDNDLGRMIRDGAAAWSEQTAKGKTIIRDVITDNLGALGSAPFRRALQSGPIGFRDLKRKKVSIYIVLPAGNIRSHGVWLRILIDTAIRELGQEKTVAEVPALLMLDEFANLGRLERVKEAVSYARGDGYRILWTIQDSNQLKELYGDSWRTLLSQTGILILLGAQDYEIREEISKDIGETVVYPRWWWWKLIFNLIWRDSHFRLEGQTVPLFRPDEIRDFCSLHRGFGLVRIRGCRWARFKRVNYDDVLEAGKDYIVHPKFGGGAVTPQIEGPKAAGMLEAA